VTALFSLKAGAARWHATNTGGESNFIVQLWDQDGNTSHLIANEIGNADITDITNVRNNSVFLLTVQSDGNWTVSVQQ